MWFVFFSPLYRTMCLMEHTRRCDPSTSDLQMFHPNKHKHFNTSEVSARVKSGPSPRQRPRLGSPPAPRWQRRPLMWSQGSVALQSWLNCMAHVLQQPQESKTELMPAGHDEGDDGHEHSDGHSLCTWRRNKDGELNVCKAESSLIS